LKKIENYFWWGFREISFNNEEISVKTKNWIIGSQIKKIRLDQINPRYETKSSYFVSTTHFIFSLLLFLYISNLIFNFNAIKDLLFFISFLILFGLASFILNNKRVVYNCKNDFFVIYSNRFNSTKVDAFILLLKSEIHQYFLTKYGYIDTDLPKEIQFSNYRWLLQNHFIDEKEYAKLKKKLKKEIAEKKS